MNSTWTSAIRVVSGNHSDPLESRTYVDRHFEPSSIFTGRGPGSGHTMYKSQIWFGFHKLPQILCYLNKNSWPSCPSSSLPAVNSAPLLPHQAASLKACPAGHPCPWDQPTNTREYPHQFHTLIHQSVHRHFTRHSQKELLQYRPLA